MHRESTVSGTRLHRPNNCENRRAAFAALSGFTALRDSMPRGYISLRRMWTTLPRHLLSPTSLRAHARAPCYTRLPVPAVRPHGTTGVGGLRRSSPPLLNPPAPGETARQGGAHLYAPPRPESHEGRNSLYIRHWILFGGHPLKLERYRED